MFLFDIQFITFCRNCFFNFTFFLIFFLFLAIIFHEKFFYYIYPRHNVFNFLWSQKLLPSNLGLHLLQESFFILNFYMVTTFKCRIFLIIFLSKSIYVLDFTSTGFNLIVVWCSLLYLLSISANLSLYTCHYVTLSVSLFFDMEVKCLYTLSFNTVQDEGV